VNEDGNLDPLTPGSHLNPLTQSPGYCGGGPVSSRSAVVVWKVIEGIGPAVVITGA